jgi:hypothetical protein
MTVVKSVSDGLRDSETQLNLNRPLRISPGPRHLSRPTDLDSAPPLNEKKILRQWTGGFLRQWTHLAQWT